MSRWFGLFSSCVVLLLLFSSRVSAQDITAQIAGTVTDETGAVVPKATVTVTNTDKDVVVKTSITDSSGNYSVPYLQVGHYSITITAGGFRKFVQQGIELHASDRYTANAQLQVGQSSQEVTVESAPVQVELQTQAATGLISGPEVREISLNNRVFEQLVTLQPGVSNGAGDQVYIGTTNPFGTVNRADFAINGARTNMNNWTIDGADNVDRGANLTLLNYPSIDAIAEFKVVRGLYNAEYGRAGGGQMNVVTRSGTSKFHGSIYEFWRNDALNANLYFTKQQQIASGQRNTPNKLRYNNFGGAIGGPLIIPGFYNMQRNKTFFFVSEEFRRVITYATAQAFLPTAAEKQGQMQFPVCVGAVDSAGTCTGATSTSVPITSPLAQAYIKDIWSKMPDPVNALTHASQVNAFRNQFDNWQNLVRIDHVFGPRLSLFGRYIHDTIPTHEPFGIFGPNSFLPGVANTQTKSPGTTWAAHATASFTPSLLFEGGYSYSYGAIVTRIEGLMNPTNSPDIKATLPFSPTLRRIPGVVYNTYSQIFGSGPYDDFNRNHTAFGSGTKVLGPHTLKFGVTYHHYQKTENANGNNNGTFTFGTDGAITSGLTGAQLSAARAAQSWANFLMGRLVTFTQASADITPDIRGHVIESFVQDEYRLRPNLTLNFGVRWMIFRQPIDVRHQLDNFDPSAYNPAKAPLINPATGLIVVDATGKPTQGDPLNGIIVAGQNSRFGGKVANENTRDFEPRVGLAWDPFGSGKTSIRTGYGISHDFIAYGNFESNIFTNPPFVATISIPGTSFDNPASGVPSISSLPKNLRIVGLPFNTPYTEQWSLDLQHELGSGMILDVGYYGAEGHHLTGFIDLNQPQVGAYVTQLGMTAPISSSTQSQRLNAIRPYLGYGAISDFVNVFGSNYHSLQSSFQKKWSNGSLVKVNYTWSHGLGDVDPTTASGYSTSSNNGASHVTAQDRYNTHLEYGPTSLDRRHVFSANWVLFSPFFRDQSGIMGHALGGWELSGILSANSGLALTPRNSPGIGATAGIANVDWPGLGCIGVSGCISMPNQVGDPNSGAPHTINQWFNSGAFVPNTSVAPGNARRGAVIGPGFWRTDLSIFKNFKLRESTTLQFRAESFNLLNHTNFNAVNMIVGNVAYNTVTSTRDPRIMQLALKLNF